MPMIHIQLFGGEQDGWDQDIEVADGAPEKFFIWPASVTQHVKETRGKAKMVLVNKISTLAYEFVGDVPCEGVPGGREHRYRRCEKADKRTKGTKTTDTAI